MKRFLIFLFVNMLMFTAYSQVTNFTNSSFTHGNGEECGRIKAFEIRPDGVLVTIEVKALKALRFLNIYSSSNTWITTGDIPLLRLSGMWEGGQLKDASANWGWSNVAMGETRSYQLYFEGKMPSGVTQVSIVDKGIYKTSTSSWGVTSQTLKHGYSFYNCIITNPRKDYVSSITDEASAKRQIDANNDGICGIYEQVDEGGLVLACVKVSGEYKLVYLSSPSSYLGRELWSVGDFKANLRQTASGVMKADWYMNNKRIESMYVLFDGYSMKVQDKKGESLYLKTYPLNSSSVAGNGDGNSEAQWTGTGFALKDGYVVTNDHVVDGASSIAVIGVNGNHTIEYKATLISTDKKNDLALIRIDDSRFTGFNSVPYAVRDRNCEVGEDVFVLGYPLTSYMGEEIKLTNGIISARSGYQGDVTTYQISAPVQPGNSGGPMFDKNGNVVGIVNSGIPGAENVGYAIKTSYLYNLVNTVSSASIIPQANQVSGGSLADKVRSVKNFVFYIKCK